MHEFIVFDEKTGITKTFYYDVFWVGSSNVKIGLFVNRTLFGKKIPGMFKLIKEFYVSYQYHVNVNFKSEIGNTIISSMRMHAIDYIHDQYKIETIKHEYKSPSLISKLCQKYNLIDIIWNALWYIVPIVFSILVINKLSN